MDSYPGTMHGGIVTRSGFMNFVRPVDKQSLMCQNSTSEKSSNKDTVTRPNDGDTARAFYENLVTNTGKESTERETLETASAADDFPVASKGQASAYVRKIFNNEKLPTFKKEDENRFGNELLKSAQNGDADSVKLFIERGVDINFRDSFGWTALMSASYGGYIDVIKCLLINGANSFVVDKTGRDARQLAQEKGHREIVKVLTTRKTPKEHTSSTTSKTGHRSNDTDGFYCIICKSEFKDTSQIKHATSTVHLFNQELKPSKTSYFIPESNRGFQMMVKGGWNSDKGLGSEGQGRKFPVKTVLKRDRHGLGSEKDEKSKAKVTHFSANDKTAVKKSKTERTMRSTTLSKKKRRRKERKDKEWERNLRIYMNSE